MVSDTFDKSHASNFSSVYKVVLEVPGNANELREIYQLSEVIQHTRFVIVQRKSNAFSHEFMEFDEFILFAIF